MGHAKSPALFQTITTSTIATLTTLLYMFLHVCGIHYYYTPTVNNYLLFHVFIVYLILLFIVYSLSFHLSSDVKKSNSRAAGTITFQNNPPPPPTRFLAI